MNSVFGENQGAHRNLPKEQDQEASKVPAMSVTFFNGACATMAVSWVQPGSKHLVRKGIIGPGDHLRQRTKLGDRFVFNLQLPASLIEQLHQPVYTRGGYRISMEAGKLHYHVDDKDHLVPCN
jgi:hypothetical protein